MASDRNRNDGTGIRNRQVWTNLRLEHALPFQSHRNIHRRCRGNHGTPSALEIQEKPGRNQIRELSTEHGDRTHIQLIYLPYRASHRIHVSVSVALTTQSSDSSRRKRSPVSLDDGLRNCLNPCYVPEQIVRNVMPFLQILGRVVRQGYSTALIL